ncbi:hypothetical protein FRC09_016055 [Ceratobasidium sp. 395]|nr:hypothetical protein FRC09_016055 [Ceratobasidium sp. 395]
MIFSVSRAFGAALVISSFFTTNTLAADCKTATVGSPYSTCYDIYTAAKITAAQLSSYNPGLDCSKLQIGQKLCISTGTLPSNAPKPNPDGSCYTYTAVSGDYCALIATKFSITTAQIESWNAGNYKWKGCASLQVGYKLCVSSGKPPPIPVNPNLQCGPESPGNATCPLKACCSAYGFCGTTADFCKASPSGDPCLSNCFMPTLPSCSTSKITRTVGYYAGWANRRKCDQVSSKQIDLTGFTHVLFAFATIGSDMKIALSTDDIPLLNDLVARKGSAKIMIAVGGWAFSQEGSNKTVFTTMIGTSANRATFITSVKSFISTYKLDGIDIDMEYPASIERGGPPSDTPNLTAFFKELRTALSSAQISLATPSGYWFLKGFELDKIAPSVSFINMMSYDYHGPWDTTVAGANSSALPQTSLDDIKESVLLYTRVGIDMSKVNLGLAWYGRSYKLKVASCNSYGCAMTGGGTKGQCTDASGVLSYSEITRLIGQNAVNYDKVGQTKWFKNAGDLITYDDKDTWAAKKDFAAKTCFGGTMVWSMDQVDPPKTPDPPTNTGKPCTEAKTWAKDYVNYEMSNFFTEYTNPTAVPVGPPLPGGCGCYSQTANLWHQVTALEGVVNYMLLTGDNQYKHHVTSAGIAFTDGAVNYLLPSGAFAESHDDALWTVLLYFKISEWLEKIGSPDSRYWDAGIKLLQWTGEGRTESRGGSSSACNGGVWWEGSGTSKTPYKNAITNELFIAASVKAYLKTKTQSYLDDAKTSWTFLKAKMFNNGLYNDGTSLPDCINNNGEPWTYNQGVVLHALGLLYQATGDHSYVDAALTTLDAVIKMKTKDNVLAETCDLPNGNCNFNGVGFKGLFMRHLQYFLEAVNDSNVTGKYSDWIGLQARAVNQYAKRADGNVGSIWYGTDSRSQYPTAVNVFSSGVDAVLASAKFGTC